MRVLQKKKFVLHIFLWHPQTRSVFRLGPIKIDNGLRNNKLVNFLTLKSVSRSCKIVSMLVRPNPGTANRNTKSRQRSYQSRPGMCCCWRSFGCLSWTLPVLHCRTCCAVSPWTTTTRPAKTKREAFWSASQNNRGKKRYILVQHKGVHYEYY